MAIISIYKMGIAHFSLILGIILKKWERSLPKISGVLARNSVIDYFALQRESVT